jgi:hypothetical protein
MHAHVMSYIAACGSMMKQPSRVEQYGKHTTAKLFLDGLFIEDDCGAERVAARNHVLSFDDSDDVSWASPGNISDSMTFFPKERLDW